MVRSSVLRTNMWDTIDRTAHWMNATNNSYKCIKRRRDFLADDQSIASFCCDISQKSDDKNEKYDENDYGRQKLLVFIRKKPYD